jgi:hypothetical protein
VNATALSAAGSTITIDSVANVSGTKMIQLIQYAGADPYAGFSLAALPSGFTGNLVDDTANHSIDLSINVAPTVSPTLRRVFFITGGQIVLSGTNNIGPGGTYHVLTTTNLSIPVTNWLVLTNGSFDGNGNFASTNAVGSNRQQFYILKVP